MWIKSLLVSNFKSIKSVELTDLPEMIIIAGPNGSGKSTLFDAIRLFKSMYGGYQPNEWHQWLSEFQILIDPRYTRLTTLFQDTNKSITIEAEIFISNEEKDYIRTNFFGLFNPSLWNQYLPKPDGTPSRPEKVFLSQIFQPSMESNSSIKDRKNEFLDFLSADIFHGKLIIPASGDERFQIEASPVLQLIFSLYLPREIGIIDYHGPQRAYQREQIGGINLNIENSQNQGSQHSLYNYVNKYSNIKAEMASSYIREILANKAGVDLSSSESLDSTLEDLFNTFIPGKHFRGIKPTPDGGLLFPVESDSGFVHDINDLSSGEKEVLYGYLRLYNLSPRHSVLLIDEPELHLNPRLVQGLPQFYQKHLGRPLENQIWLLTHSDAMLREALETENAEVFHLLLPETIDDQENQIRRVTAKEDIDQAIIDLVGDLATYKPDAKVVVFEGGGGDDFDIHMVSSLFPEFIKAINPISGSNKSSVKKLHALLEKARDANIINAQVFCIVDKDSESYDEEYPNSFSWDVYHIENYLLEPEFIQKVFQQNIRGKQKNLTLEKISEELLVCAQETLPFLISHKIHNQAQGLLVKSISFKIDNEHSDPVNALITALEKSKGEFLEVMNSELANTNILSSAKDIRLSYEADIKSGKWASTFRGRDVLKRFAGKLCKGINYDLFRNMIITEMRASAYKPEGMSKLIKKISDIN